MCATTGVRHASLEQRASKRTSSLVSEVLSRRERRAAAAAFLSACAADAPQHTASKNACGSDGASSLVSISVMIPAKGCLVGISRSWGPGAWLQPQRARGEACVSMQRSGAAAPRAGGGGHFRGSGGGNRRVVAGPTSQQRARGFCPRRPA